MREAIWKSMLDADMNARYWKSLVKRYSNREKYLKIFLALMASGTVAGWGFWQSFPIFWKILSSISAITAIALPILNYQKTIGQMSFLSGKWGELRIEYEDLWFQVKSKQANSNHNQAYKKYRKIESSLEKRESTLPDDQKLLKKCFDDVKQSRGLNNRS